MNVELQNGVIHLDGRVVGKGGLRRREPDGSGFVWEFTTLTGAKHVLSSDMAEPFSQAQQPAAAAAPPAPPTVEPEPAPAPAEQAKDFAAFASGWWATEVERVAALAAGRRRERSHDD